MGDSKKKKSHRGLCSGAVAGLMISVAVCSFLIVVAVMNRMNMEELRMERLAADKSLLISDEIERPLYKTQALAALVIQGEGDIENFEAMASRLMEGTLISNMLLAPGGIVKRIYPLEGNEAVMGLNLFDGGPGSEDAVLAKDTGSYILSASFQGVQGRSIVAGRLPVYLDTPDGKQQFWGMVSVTLPFPEILKNAKLEELEAQGYAYELWVTPSKSGHQVLAGHAGSMKEGSAFLTRVIPVYGAEWRLVVSNMRLWYHYPQNVITVMVGLLICFAVFWIMQYNTKLRQIRVKLEFMAQSDPLTGIYNRRHFMDRVQISAQKAGREGHACFMIIMDLDEFKMVNDRYGHLAGDRVLIEVTARLRSQMRSNDLFARFGGEEFIIFVSGGDERSACQVAERIRLCISDKKFYYENLVLEMTASFGVARIEGDLEKAIKQADSALYQAKNNGRNRVVCYAPADVQRTAG